MFLAHYGVGLAAKRLSPETSTGLLVIAAAGPDILFGALAVLGIERAGIPTPWTHGLFMAGMATIAVFGIAWIASRRLRTALVLSAAYFSHWTLDFISHPMGLGKRGDPDIFLFLEGSPLVGLGLYNSLPAALITEIGLFAAGIAVYLNATRASGPRGTLYFWVFMAAMLLLIPLNALIPPSLAGWGCAAQLILLPLGLWVDHHRASRIPPEYLGHA